MSNRNVLIAVIAILCMFLTACGSSSGIVGITMPSAASSANYTSWCGDYKDAARADTSNVTLYNIKCYTVSGSTSSFKTNMRAAMRDAGYTFEYTDSEVVSGIRLTIEIWEKGSTTKALSYFSDAFIIASAY